MGPKKSERPAVSTGFRDIRYIIDHCFDVCIYVYMYIYIYVNICKYMYIHVYIYVYLYMYTDASPVACGSFPIGKWILDDGCNCVMYCIYYTFKIYCFWMMG